MTVSLGATKQTHSQDAFLPVTYQCILNVQFNLSIAMNIQSKRRFIGYCPFAVI